MTQVSKSTILTLDLGTKTGWALHYQGGRITSGTKNFETTRFDGGGIRYLYFKRWLDESRKKIGVIDAIYFESVRRHLGVDAAHAYGGFFASLSAWCEKHAIPYGGIPVGTIKKHITGKGNANKAQVIQAVKSKGYDPEDDNEADALALLDLILTRKREVQGETHEYTASELADRFEETILTLKRLYIPGLKPQSYFNAWPAIVYETWEIEMMEKDLLRLGLPLPEEISRMEEALNWLWYVDEAKDRHLLWMRAKRVHWKTICNYRGCGRTTAWRDWNSILRKLADHLNSAENKEKS